MTDGYEQPGDPSFEGGAAYERHMQEHTDAVVFKCDEAACRLDARFYEGFDMDERWEIIRAILEAAVLPRS